MARGGFVGIRQAVLSGGFAPGGAPAIAEYGERQARNVPSGLVEQGLLRTEGPQQPARPEFPIVVVERRSRGTTAGRVPGPKDLQRTSTGSPGVPRKAPGLSPSRWNRDDFRTESSPSTDKSFT